jgi:hypothetical protein
VTIVILLCSSLLAQCVDLNTDPAFRMLFYPGIQRNYGPELATSIQKWQEQCLTQCFSISNALYCQDASCVCPILDAASASVVSTCEDCLNSYGYSDYSSLISLAYQVCTMCYDQCAFILTAAIETESCTTLACFCPVLQPGGANDLESCANCIHSFNSQEASILESFATGCGFASSLPAPAPRPPAPATAGNQPPATISRMSTPGTETLPSSCASRGKLSIIVMVMQLSCILLVRRLL